MILVKIFFNGEDLTETKGALIRFDSVRELESQGFAVQIIKIG